MRKRTIPSSIIAQVKNRADLAEVVGQYVALDANLKTLCPFHSEETPSFSIQSKKQRWRCFGCQAAGDVFDFVKRAESVDFSTAVQLLADIYGIPIPHTERLQSYHQARRQAKQERRAEIDALERMFLRFWRWDRDRLLQRRRKLYAIPREHWGAEQYQIDMDIDNKFDELDVVLDDAQRKLGAWREEGEHGIQNPKPL